MPMSGTETSARLIVIEAEAGADTDDKHVAPGAWARRTLERMTVLRLKRDAVPVEAAGLVGHCASPPSRCPIGRRP